MSLLSEPNSLFGRSWAVTIGPEGQEGSKFAMQIVAEGLAGGYLSNLRVTFDLTKTTELTSNKAKIQVYNLSQSDRLKFQKKGLFVLLEAGYQGLTETVYSGEVVRMVTKREGASILTEFECGDAEKSIENSHFDQSYPPGTPLVKILQDIAKAMDLDYGTVLGIPAKVYTSPQSLSGTCKSILKKLLDGFGLEASVQNGALQIIPVDKHNGSSPISLSKTTGLVGVPSQKESGVEFTALLNPKLKPGQCVQLITGTIAGQFSALGGANSITGFYKIRTSHFEGDSHQDKKWHVTCEATPCQSFQTLGLNAGENFTTAVTVA